MESIDILTGQNVIIRYQTATVLQRIGARLLDNFFILAYIFFIFFFSFLFWETVKNLISPDYMWIAVILLLLPVIGYHFIFESILGGTTLGKMIVKIKVTNSDGSTTSIGSYFLRWVLSPVDLFMGGSIGILFILLSKNHQRLGDMAAGTIVVKTNPSLSFDLDESYYVFPDNYEPTFIHVSNLTEGQIAFITNMLVEPKNKNAINSSIIELANKVKSILNIDSNLDEWKFLETIVRDYNYYAALEI